jgi:DNA-directed RNA polymerase specialized sigma24 family protein
MGRKKRQESAPSISAANSWYPETQSKILEAAAAGDWQAFLQSYLAPICTDLQRFGKRFGINLTDQDDLRQDLMLRLMTPKMIAEIAQCTAAEPVTTDANLVGRYLTQPGVTFRSGRFRAYLHGVIRNVVLESLRRRANLRHRTVPWDEAEFAAAVDESLSHAMDRQWIGHCLDEAACAVRRDAATARSKARRREFEILCLALVDRKSVAEIAQHYGLEENTASGCLRDARERFVQHLERLTGIDHRGQLKQAVAAIPDRLVDALSRARAAKTDSSVS